MKIKVVVDTSLLVAQIDGKDVWHEQAADLAGGFADVEAELIYFDCVVNEAISVLARRLLERKSRTDFKSALGKMDTLILTENITWIYPAIKKYYEKCLEIIRDHGGKINFHDSLIALAMRDLDLGLIGSFDKDFDDIAWLRRLATRKDCREDTAGSSSNTR